LAKLLEYGLSEGVPNKTYHADDYFTSSTAVKLLYYDIPKYEAKYIHKTDVEDSDKPAFTIGSLYHSELLEPEMVATDYAFFNGWDGRTSGFQEFKVASKPKTVVTQSQKMQVDKMVDSFRKHPVAPKLLAGGKNELTLCVDLFGVPVKVRFDHINIEEGYILDLKTSGYSVDYETFKMQGIGNLKYEISAGLYTLAAEEHFGKPFDFYFGCSSKKDYNTEVFKTGVATMSNGKVRCKIGLERLKHYREHGQWPEGGKKKQASGDYIIQEL
jgi:hypothetical protein